MVHPLDNSHDSLIAPIQKQTPWWWYAVSVLVAVLVGTAAAYPKALLALIVLSAVAALLVAAARDPWVALAIIVAQYPVMNTLRTIYTAHHLPVFAGGVRFFPDLLQFLILGQLLIRGIKDPRYRLRVFGDDLPVLVYVIVGIYSVVVAVQYTNPLGPINGWYVSMTPAIFYFVIRWLQPTPQQASRFLKWMLGCFLVLMALSFPAYFIRPPWYMVLQHAEHAQFVPKGMDPMVFWRFFPRMQSFLFEENIWGSLCQMVAMIAAAYLGLPGKPFKRYALILFATLGMICSISRGAMIAYAIGTVVLLLFPGRHQKRILAVLVVVAAVAGVAIISLRNTPLIQVTLSRLDTVSTNAARKGEIANDRVQQWKAGWQIFVLNPSGTGLGTVGYGASLSKVTNYVVGDGVYVRILAEQGVPGILAFLYMILSIPWMLWRYRDHCPEEWRPLGIGLFAFHIGFCIQGIGANSFDHYCVVPCYFMLLGLYINAVHRHIRQQTTGHLLAEPEPATPLLAAKGA